MKISKTPSAPCWVDLSTPDTDGARLFYEGLFGWRGEVVPDPRAGGYGMFAGPGGALVGGFGPTRSPKQPAAWLPYFQSAGVDAVVARVKGNGGSVVAGPMGVMEQGKLAVCQDPAGAAFGLWQPVKHPGFGVVNEPVSVCWFELLTRDPAGSEDFYQSILGWGARRRHLEQGEYTEWSVDAETFGGMLDTASDSFPEELPAHWMVYLAVADADATAARCKELGGQILVHPTTIEPGRFSVLADPRGASFAVITYAAR
ncbi:VOC family protein [Streptomyces antnestii]|uniref:VOC family protein n=1 Tax=Streptomyces antnestii TaxID=2494256 RepID=A0A3S2VH17_9ACTN|nr:VOC family protein [Streptomyces sp. San01]RVU26285.1 VOC family protein [Streptomyces sp. San01]